MQTLTVTLKQRIATLEGLDYEQLRQLATAASLYHHDELKKLEAAGKNIYDQNTKDEDVRYRLDGLAAAEAVGKALAAAISETHRPDKRCKNHKGRADVKAV